MRFIFYNERIKNDIVSDFWEHNLLVLRFTTILDCVEFSDYFSKWCNELPFRSIFLKTNQCYNNLTTKNTRIRSTKYTLYMANDVSMVKVVWARKINHRLNYLEKCYWILFIPAHARRLFFIRLAFACNAWK